ncbi:hypothetical protein BaRGS_00022698 [Batillaria attramentaria]|uniref:Uncharacterized protein n=1 Tax=Batillaria attramentaria TaxID=370345 RepID=A0ABD0KGB3_9CAEN
MTSEINELKCRVPQDLKQISLKSWPSEKTPRLQIFSLLVLSRDVNTTAAIMTPTWFSTRGNQPTDRSPGRQRNYTDSCFRVGSASTFTVP